MTVPAIADDGRDRPRSLSDYEPSGGATAGSRPAGRRAHLRLVRSEVPPPWWPTEPQPVLVLVLRQVVEVLDGRRPVGQLRGLVPDSEVADLRERVGRGERYALRSVHTCCPVPGAVEVAAAVAYRSAAGRRRVLAAAARFERMGNRWLCTVFRLL